jgi:hypothetical protein
MSPNEGAYGSRRCVAVSGLTLLALWSAPGGGIEVHAQQFLRGDANADGIVSVSDILTIRRFLFIGGIELSCIDAADADDGQPVDGCNCNPEAGRLNISDAVTLIRYLFIQPAWSSILPEPFPIPGLDPTPDEAGCEGYAVQPPVPSEDVLRVGEVEAAPGETVEIPVYLTTSVPVEAVQLVIGYDPAVFTPIEGADGISYAGTYYDPAGGVGTQAPINLVKSHPESGLLVVGFAGSLISEGYEVPPGDETLFLKIRGTIAAGASAGIMSLEPTNGPDEQGVGPYRMRNEVTFRGGARFATALPRRAAGLLRIVGPDGMDFRHGDSNSDGQLDLSDAVFTLLYLFSEGTEPQCPDAADINDDGRLDLSDPISGLNYLFAPSGLESPLSPAPDSCGPDIRADTLEACSRSSCS